MLAVAATQGKNLFEAIDLTAKYFFDALEATYAGSLTYRAVEHAKDLAAHPTVESDVKEFMARLLMPFTGRKRILFACRENACRSQMAAAYAETLAADRLEVLTGGSEPAKIVHPEMVKAMAEEGIDLYFQVPQSIESALAEGMPDAIVTMGCGETCPIIPGAVALDWQLPDPAGQSSEFMRRTRDEIKKKVVKLIDEL